MDDAGQRVCGACADANEQAARTALLDAIAADHAAAMREKAAPFAASARW
jgi:hypothetical protein